MILNDDMICKYLESGRIGISPSPDYETQIQPASVDLRLDDTYISFDGVDCIDTRGDGVDSNIKHFSDTEPLVLAPGEFVLCQTLECVRVPDDLLARVEGRSSIGRLGVTVHVTAGFIDPGFVGNITLEMVNLGGVSVVLYPRMRVCQVVFEELCGVCVRSYGVRGKYMGQCVPTVSGIFDDVDSK